MQLSEILVQRKLCEEHVSRKIEVNFFYPMGHLENIGSVKESGQCG